MSSKALQSKAFPLAYLRIDGSGVRAAMSGGGGTVNCQSGVGDCETLEERPQPDGTVALASVLFPDVFLRMDGSGVTSASDSGAGTVNCQLGVGPWEKFHKRAQPDGTVAFESAAFPGTYLRMDARGIGEFGSAAGAGTVNCQFGVGPWEKFLLLDPPFPPVRWPHTSTNSQTFRGADYDSDYIALTDTNYIYTANDGSGIGTTDYDFVATGSVGTSASLGAPQDASSVELPGLDQDPDQSR
jgi:phospholipase C